MRILLPANVGNWLAAFSVTPYAFERCQVSFVVPDGDRVNANLITGRCLIRPVPKLLAGFVFNSIYLFNATRLNIDGLVQERRNSIAHAVDLRISFANPLIC